MSSRRLLLLALSVATVAGCKSAPSFTYDIPVQANSPWPKFRRDAAQDGLSPVHAQYQGGKPWSFTTGAGIFSSPIVGADGTVYLGSADRYFYALDPAGTLKWKLLTGEIIDSSGLLDDTGNIYFGSGDGQVYALNAATGSQVWTFEADQPSTINSGFSYINWFEGNIALGANGDLYAPNDNNLVYSLNRTTGAKNWSYLSSDQNWSLPAINTTNGQLFFGNNSVLGAILGSGSNIFSLDSTGSQEWSAFTLGTVAASALLTSDGGFVIGSFDGYVREYDQATSEVRWSFATRDHLYASPAQLPDGTIIQAGVDGSVYALNPKTGALIWQYDTLNPIRASPAVDADGNIYVGTGGGQLLVLTKDGLRRWEMLLIDQDRADLNASPALGLNAVYLGGEDGNVYAVPYDYCLNSPGKSDSACQGGGTSGLPVSGASLYFTTSLGEPLTTPPTTIDANDSLAFSLYVRENDQTQLALLDSASLMVTVTPPTPVSVTTSGDARFMTVVPTQDFTADSNGNVTIDIAGQYLENFQRTGLVLKGGTDAGSFSGHYVFQLSADSTSPFPLAIPTQPGDPTGAWEMYRLAAPLPTVLPSYNQIGFDSLHYVMGLVEGTPESAIAWVVGATLATDSDTTIFDPTTKSVFPVQISYTDGRVTMLNQAGFTLEAMNADISFDSFRYNARVDSTGTNVVAPHLVVKTLCSHIPTFGSFLEAIGFCNQQTGELVAFGSALLRPFVQNPLTMPSGLGTVAFSTTTDALTATVTGSTMPVSAHSYWVLMVDASTGAPVPAGYGLQTTVTPDANGNLAAVSLPLAGVTLPASMRVYLLVDAYPAARATLTAP